MKRQQNLSAFRVIACLTMLGAFNYTLICCCGPNMTSKFYQPCIYYQNSKGQDLLDADTQGHITKDSILIHWKVDGTDRQMAGEVVPFFPAQQSYMPSGYYLHIYQDVTTTQLIQLNRLDYDTITYVYSQTVLQKVFYNNKLISPPTGMSSYPIGNFPVIVIK